MTVLSDAEWNLLEPHLPPPNKRGRPRQHAWREILNSIFYIVRSGCAWRLLPHDLPSWKTLYHYYRLWRMDGTFQRIHQIIREKLGIQLGRAPQPSAGVIDSQTVKTTGVGGAERGFDGGKKISGRWVVERTFSWMGQNRRLSKDYERLSETSEAMIYAAMTRVMVRRLVKT